MNLVYKHEKMLFIIAFIISTVVWLALIVGTFGIALIYILLIALFGLFARSRFIAHIKGNGVKITAEQFPNLQQRLNYCCDKLQITNEPEAYILRTDFFNALATKFLGKNYIVLFSDVIDALEDNEDAINFYIGHELGHIHRKHLRWMGYLLPALVLPLLGYAYRRAEEYTCDRYGAACCQNDKSSMDALITIAAGDTKWKDVNVDAYLQQAENTTGFWMSFNELTSDYPWLTKRASAVDAFNKETRYKAPRRSFFAWVFACLVPRLGFGGGAGLIVTVAIIGILAAIAIPQYQTYVQRSQVMRSYNEASQLTSQIDDYLAINQKFPESLIDLGYPESTYTFDNMPHSIELYENGVIGINIAQPVDGEEAYVVIEKNKEDDGQIWFCYGQNVKPMLLPMECR